MKKSFDYEIVRSARKTIGIEVKQGKVTVRAPRTALKRDIEAFVRLKEAWILKHLEKQREAADVEALSEEALKRLADEALRVIPERVAYYALLIGVDYGRITVRNQRTRWGSCSSQGNLNFNCLLVLTPVEVMDSVIVHELCHRKEMNHSKRFYDEVLKVYPEYHKWHGWLKDNGGRLLRLLG